MPSELAGGNEVWRHIQIPLHSGTWNAWSKHVVDLVKWNVFLAGRCCVETISAVCEHTSFRFPRDGKNEFPTEERIWRLG